ncbi:MAG: T9SS type A sorting domain-containing protein [Cyclobacteriaceae bacterium]|nr:T9SS type A sorting domain-containing protein [Cyclobacteriaceae bacterium]
MKTKLPILIISSALIIIVYLLGKNQFLSKTSELTSQQAWDKQILEKRAAKKAGVHKYDGPDEFALFQRGIRTKEGETAPSYPTNYAIKELEKAKSRMLMYVNNAKSSGANTIVWTERGPANVPGRTRVTVVMPQDATQNTWVIGSVGGGIWKTTDGGSSWIEKTKDLPNIAFTTIALVESNPSILYAGTGEGGLGGADLITGNGIFKSVDEGETWTQLASTAGNVDFQNINRLIVDPNDENIIVICTTNSVDIESGIFKTVDGGANWTNTLLSTSSSRKYQHIVATPGNFNVQYAASNGEGVWKSIDAGDSWTLSNTGMSPNGRVEIAVSPVNPNRVFASTEGPSTGSGSDLYVSSDAGATWTLVEVSFSGTSANYLGGQGWFDNTVLCSPYDENVVYAGGVSIVKVVLGTGGSSTAVIYNVEENGTDIFMSFVSFSASAFGGALDVGDDANETSVEIRFGAGLSQKAHRFTVPAGQGSGVPDGDYSYQDYVDVPFEAWDTDANRQLMVSFRDQQVDGVFNLFESNTSGATDTHSREYLYVNNVDYNATTPDAGITVNGGHIFKQMYNLWPVLTPNATWDAASLPSSTLNIMVTEVDVLDADTDIVADPYNDFDGTNSFSTFGVDVHPDHHELVAIKEDDAAKTFRILLSTDGGPFISKTSANPGVTEGDWTMVGNTYNTGQFYGADKKPGEDAYFGGLQDNGTWQSPVGADATTNYSFKIGGDGFEVLWNNNNPDKLIGGSQFNSFRRSTNGGASFVNATSGLSGDHPFISKLANSKALPDVIYTVSSDGVFKSENFGQNWNLTSITNFWDTSNASSFMDVEVSRADANIIWAGSGISSTRRIHVSTDQGQTFTETSSSSEVSGRITRLASHPTEPNTAYALFSFAKSAKILRTDDLGVTWADISGFGTNTTSSTGFPDVAVYCLYVHTDNPDILWVGTDIGIVESLDNGATWNLLDSNMPKVAVWDMKGQDNQIVIATHGRGIWTATVSNSQTAFKETPTITAYGTSPQKELALVLNVTEAFDSTQIFIDEVYNSTLLAATAGEYILYLEGISAGNKEVKLINYFNGAPFQSARSSVVAWGIFNTATESGVFFNNPSNHILSGLEIKPFETTLNEALQSPHNYQTNSELSNILKQPIIVSSTNSIFNYKDIALVEPGDTGASFGEAAFNDYVVVEATKDGLNWIPIEDGYDASAQAKWQTAYTSSAEVTYGLYVNHAINLTNKFSVGDTLLFRFRMFSNAQNVGWGWSVDNIYIQTEPLGVEKASEVSAYSIYPVPSKGDFTIDYELTGSTEVLIEIMTVTGQKIKTYDLGQKTSGSYRFKLEDYTLENGVYIFSLRTKTGISSQRVLISN